MKILVGNLTFYIPKFSTISVFTFWYTTSHLCPKNHVFLPSSARLMLGYIITVNPSSQPSEYKYYQQNIQTWNRAWHSSAPACLSQSYEILDSSQMYIVIMSLHFQPDQSPHTPKSKGGHFCPSPPGPGLILRPRSWQG